MPVDAVALLERVNCDLVITDGFSKAANAVFTNTRDVLQRAGVTPVALFSAHTLKLEQVREAGFRSLILKLFDIDTLLQQGQALPGRRGTDHISVFYSRIYSSWSEQRGVLA